MKEELPRTLGESLKRLFYAEERLQLIARNVRSHGTHYGILFHGIPSKTLLEDLPKTKTWNGQIDHGAILARIVLESESKLKEEIKNHPILARRILQW